MFDDQLEKVVYTYHCSQPIIEQQEATYADTSAKVNLTSIGWNHGLSEVVSALLPYLKLVDFKEYNYSPYPIFSENEEIASGKYQPKAHCNKLPLVYSLAIERRRR